MKIWKICGFVVGGLAAVFFVWLIFCMIDEPSFDWNIFSGKSLPESSVSQPIAPKEATFIFGGDVMLSRQVGQKMVKYDDYLWPFSKIASTTAAADLAMVNLESPLVVADDYFVPTGSFSFKADPRAIAGLKEAGIDIVDLANNHFANYGRQGMKDTFFLLEKENIAYVGAGRDLDLARRGEIRNLAGHCFAFLGFAYPEDGSLATSQRAGIVGMEKGNAASDIRRLADSGCLVIVSMHAGVEYTRQPNWQQQEFARAAIDAGAELVIGHHPHWPQTTEIYKGKLIIYSLGNLVFDQMWSPETSEGVMAELHWREGCGFYQGNFVPLIIRDYGQPDIMIDGEEKERLFEKLELPSDGIISIPCGEDG